MLSFLRLGRRIRGLFTPTLMLALLTSVTTPHAYAGDSTTVPPTVRVKRTVLEESLVQEALSHFTLEEDPKPDGKRIEGVEIYVAEVLDDRDPLPNFFNFLHVRTQDPIVRQELLLHVGEQWDFQKVLESERNLRAIRQHSLANVVAVRGSRADTIRLLVVVKDVWSLRLNSDPELGSDGIDMLFLNPTEENFLGTRTSLGLSIRLQRDRYALGANFGYPRIGGSRFAMTMAGGVYNSRRTGDYEGNFGSFSFFLPQYSRFQKWSYGVSSSWNFATTRRFRGGQIDTVRIRTSAGEEEVDVVYEGDRIQADYSGLRSFGVEHKRDLSFGLSVNHLRFRPQDSAEISPAARQVFVEQVLPRSDTRIGPVISFSVYESRFLRTADVETLSIQEDLRLGYGVSTAVFVGGENFGSTRNFVGSRGSLGYSFPLSDGLFRIATRGRFVAANHSRHEASVTSRARVVSPHLGWGRIHLDGLFSHFYHNYLNLAARTFGGNNRLRGYKPFEFRGSSATAFNGEIRTTAVDILSAQVGLVVFYDLGAAAPGPKEYRFYQSAGVGLRTLIPQFDRIALRLDWGFPLSGDRAAWPGGLYFAFDQAFSMQSIFGN